VPDFQIHTIDLCFHYWPESIASFLVMGPEGAALKGKEGQIFFLELTPIAAPSIRLPRLAPSSLKT
jgi:hypothetical protein